MTAAARHAAQLLDDLVPDPAELTPSCGEPEFAARLAELVADEAPRLFAVVQEYGERVDATIAAWGMAFTDHAEVSSLAGPLRLRLRTPENALHLFTVGSRLRARLVWFDPEAVTRAES